MNQQPYSPEQRSLRRHIALALLFSPTMCVLPVLAFVASQSTIRWVIWGIWAVITIILLTVIGRAATRLRALTNPSCDQEQEQTSSPGGKP